jgi:uncharacterized protein
MSKSFQKHRPAFEQAWQYAQTRLERELSPLLKFHSVDHTRDDVVPAVDRLATLLSLSDEQMLLLRTAAWYHDLGFVQQRIDHEMVSIKIAHAVLPQFGFNQEQVTTVEQLILATRLPQRPQTLLAQILADADLDSLGREDFLVTSLALRDELAAFGDECTLLEWYTRQHQFLHDHRYFTDAARLLRSEGKQRNLEILQMLAGS